MNNDRPTAKLEAIARAKWQAIEQTLGVDVKAGSFVSNFALVEDVMKTQVGGSVKKYTLLRQEEKNDVLTVKINACVEPKKAQEAIASELSLNSGIAVFIPARKPRAASGEDVYEETNILSETLISRLTEQNYKVVDVAPTHTLEAAEIEKAVRSGSTLAVRSMLYKFLANIAVIGRTDYTISTKKGEDIGYGLSMPFNNVTVRLNYRLVARNNKTGNMEILAAGTEQGKGIRTTWKTPRRKPSGCGGKCPKLLDKVAYVRNVRRSAYRSRGSEYETNINQGDLAEHRLGGGSGGKGLGEFIVTYRRIRFT